MHNTKSNLLRERNADPTISLGSLIGNQAFLVLNSAKEKDRPIQRRLIIEGSPFRNVAELEDLVESSRQFDILKSLHNSTTENFHFKDESDMNKYVRSVEAHIDSMNTICDSKRYDRRKANDYLRNPFPCNNPINPGRRLNCWTSVIKAALVAKLDTEESLLTYCRAKETEDRFDDPYLMLMDNALEYNLTDKSPQNISDFFMTIPAGDIVAFDTSSDRTRNAHVFVSIGNGVAVEFDENDKGHKPMIEIYNRYSGMQKIYYCRPPWLKGISNFTGE